MTFSQPEAQVTWMVSCWPMTMPLERSKGAFIGGIVGDGEQEAVFRDGAGLRILHHADDLDGQRLAEPQLRRAGAGPGGR